MIAFDGNDFVPKDHALEAKGTSLSVRGESDVVVREVAGRKSGKAGLGNGKMSEK